jgi:hypothetical protein
MVPCGKVRCNDDDHKAGSHYMEVHMKALSDDMVHSFAAVKVEIISVITVYITGEAISMILVSDEYYKCSKLCYFRFG